MLIVASAAVLLKAHDILRPEPAEATVPLRCSEQVPILLAPSPFPKIELLLGPSASVQYVHFFDLSACGG